LFLEEQLKLTRLGTMRYWSSEFKRLRSEKESENYNIEEEIL
jgi:hypothetical protein